MTKRCKECKWFKKTRGRGIVGKNLCIKLHQYRTKTALAMCGSYRPKWWVPIRNFFLGEPK